MAALSADNNEKNLRAFKDKMNQVVTLPGRARSENRLHRNKGCKYCLTPCRYGYFTLVSDPEIKQLQELFNSETGRPAAEQTPSAPGLCLRHRPPDEGYRCQPGCYCLPARGQPGILPAAAGDGEISHGAAGEAVGHLPGSQPGVRAAAEQVMGGSGEEINRVLH